MVEKPAEPKADIYSLGKVIADMAKATGDKNLQKMATIYTIPDTHRRPDTIEKLRKQPSPRRKQLATRANARWRQRSFQSQPSDGLSALESLTVPFTK